MANVMNLELIRKGDELMALAFKRNPNLALPNHEETKMIYEDVESKVVGIRFPVSLLNWIDAFSREKAFLEGWRVTRNNVVIDALEAQWAIELSKQVEPRP